MPFTFSHPAILLPLINKRRKIFSATGLVLGSLIPDFEAFIRLDVHKHYSHTWLGIFWFDLPLAVLVSFLFHTIVRDPLIAALPAPLHQRFARFIGFNWLLYFKRHFAVVLISLLIGIASHLLWDAFTHLNLVYPNAVDSKIYITRGFRLFRVRLYKLLQYSNSLIGMYFVILHILKMPRQQEQQPIQRMIFVIDHHKEQNISRIRYWALVGVFTVLSIGLFTGIHLYHLDIILLIYIVLSGFLLSLILTPLYLKLIR